MQRRGRPDRRDEACREPQYGDRARTRLLQRRDVRGPILWKAGITDIATATTAPKLTAPDRKPEYDGFMRTVYSDIDQGAADAKYVHDVLKAQKIVTIHDGSAYAQQLATVMADNFKKLGGTVLSQEAVAPTDVDMHPVLTRIATEKPDVIYAPVFVAAGAQLLRQAKEISGP